VAITGASAGIGRAFASSQNSGPSTSGSTSRSRTFFDVCRPNAGRVSTHHRGVLSRIRVRYDAGAAAYETARPRRRASRVGSRIARASRFKRRTSARRAPSADSRTRPLRTRARSQQRPHLDGAHACRQHAAIRLEQTGADTIRTPEQSFTNHFRAITAPMARRRSCDKLELVHLADGAPHVGLPCRRRRGRHRDRHSENAVSARGHRVRRFDRRAFLRIYGGGPRSAALRGRLRAPVRSR
jgi:hypothetical protein